VREIQWIKIHGETVKSVLTVRSPVGRFLKINKWQILVFIATNPIGSSKQPRFVICEQRKYTAVREYKVCLQFNREVVYCPNPRHEDEEILERISKHLHQ